VSSYDAIVVGAGPNGLSAAITLARAGQRVLVIEAADSVGGGTRSEELTLPGFLHDVCSAVHTTGVVSPFFTSIPLQQFGLSWRHPELSVAHPLDGQPAVLLQPELDRTASDLGPDGAAYRKLLEPLLRRQECLIEDLLGPLRWPRDPIGLARFGLLGLRSAAGLARGRFVGERARALFAGCAAHSILPLERMITAGVALLFLLIGHVRTWPVARGGSRSITAALERYFLSLGGEVRVGQRVTSLAQLPESRAVLFDLDPRQIVGLCGEALPAAYKRRLLRYRYGPGVFKLDWALSEAIPWRDPACGRASTVHVGGSLDEIAASEAGVWKGEHCDRPFVMLCQQSHFDDSRAPVGKHTGYAYCHVPPGSVRDMTTAIESQVERFAPGFRDTILARHAFDAVGLEHHNPCYVGGAITGGAADLGQLFTRPVARLDPYSTPNPRLFLCSHSTPPGGGVHGMCGYYAARSVLRRSGGATDRARA
jgi:phytoene dehydrogenase-like protein